MYQILQNNYLNSLYTVIRNQLLLVISIVFSLNAYSQEAQTSLDAELTKKRTTKVIIGGSAFYAASMIGLNELWYADFEKSKFHFFNDNKEWLLIDKVGHSLGAYHFSKAAMSSLEWAGMDHEKSRNYGALYGLIFQSTIEVLDGYSKKWGASTGDIIANTAGIAMLWSQDIAWSEQRITPKFSYHKSDYADLRPNTFGSGLSERTFKDYNGQTHWLSLNLRSFTNEDSRIPKWLNLAVGYGADGMTGAEINPSEFGSFDRIRQYYFSLDADLWRIETKSKFLKTAFSVLSIIKVPAPTVEFEKNEANFYWLYF